MKSLRVLLPLALLSIATAGFAQSDAQKSFDTLKTLGGDWEGPVAVNPPMPEMSGGSNLMHISMRVTSRGHAIVHEMQESGTPLDPKKYDHPVTMLYLTNDQLNLVHYCDAGNRPHMLARAGPSHVCFLLKPLTFVENQTSFTGRVTGNWEVDMD